MRQHPHILFVILDTLRRDRLSVYGHDRPTSPHFDAFAAGATLFERAVAPAQWTIPAHASMFTGVYPGRHRVTQSNSRLSDDQPVLAELLRAGGYHTIAFCNNPLVGVLENGLQRGFDAFHNYASAVPSRPFDYRKPWLRREFSRRFRPYARRIANQFARSDWLFRVSLQPALTPIWTRYINFKGNTANAISDVIEYWDLHQQQRDDRPLFAFVNLMGAHLPYHPPQDVLERLAPDLKNDRQAYAFMNQFNADGAAWASPPEPPFEDWQQHTLHAFYDAEIAWQDEQLGRLLDHLRSTGALEDTVVVIAADHGEGHGEHDLFGHGFSVHQELVHVPLVIRAPQFSTARVGENISTRRLFHTLLDLANVQPPDDALRAEISGLSLASGASPEDDLAFSEAFPVNTFMHVLEHRNPSVIERMRLRMVRRAVYAGDHKLILADSTPQALYHISDDPFETRDLLTSAPALTADLRRRISALTGTEDADPEADLGAYNEDDEQVLEHLRSLGYIE
ncbi:sulfatase [Anaerolineae bacterium CFX9]|nr:sulfatase [Anaerolineae bacterium CFX9]